jgi:hypothetical protein
MGNFKGEKKRNSDKPKFKLLIIFWEDEVLCKNELLFDELEDAMNFDVDRDCQIKIYDYKERLIHSKVKEKKPHKHQEGEGHHHHGHGHGHDHDDDYV